MFGTMADKGQVLMFGTMADKGQVLSFVLVGRPYKYI